MNLQSRILLFFVALLLVIQSISFWMIRRAIEDNARSTISSQLEVGERVFQRSLQSRGSRLGDATEVLASDFGFKSAIGSRDQATINSALENQRGRAKARSAFFFDEKFTPLGSVGAPFPERSMGALRAKASVTTKGSASIMASDGATIHQFSMAPVKAPLLLGWVVMEFPIDASTLSEFKTLSGFESTLAINMANGSTLVSLTSFDQIDDASAIQAALSHPPQGGPKGYDHRSMHLPDTVEIGSTLYGARAVPLATDAGSTSYALLMQSIDKAREPYEQLQWTLVFLAIGGVGIFAFGGFLLARSISRPIVELSRAAESMAQGDYSALLPKRSPGEVGDLSDSFDHMRVALGERERRIRQLAYWDELTGLPNREQFREKLAAMIELGSKADPVGKCSVVELDIDRIKNVNDSLGQSAGDELLREVANRLRSIEIPVEGLCARLSGDKFAMMLPGMDAAAALQVAEKLHQAFEPPAHINGSRIDISAGIGVCCIPDQASGIEQALTRVEVAMYAAKAAKSGTMAYEPKFDNSSEDSLSLLSELRDALANGELRLHYQAKADLATGEIIAAEALARWQHPTRGAMAPYTFIPFAEQTGFIGQISRWAARESCKAIAGLCAAGKRIKISANISTRDLMDPDFLNSLSQSLAETGADPTLLCLEVTESALMENPDKSLQSMAAIRALGVELSIDDFGTGYSSLGYLRKMPINELKIDRVFILGLIGGSSTDEKIVSSTIELAHGLGLKVVAEGVEDPRAFDKLRLIDCDIVQGFGVSKPIPLADFTALLDTWKPSMMPSARKA